MTSSLPELSFQDGPVTGRPGDFSGTIVSQLLSNPESNSGNRIQNFLEEKHIFLTGSTGFLAKVRPNKCSFPPELLGSPKPHHHAPSMPFRPRGRVLFKSKDSFLSA